MNQPEAKAAGRGRYLGAPCAKHPELNGERRTASGKCVGCTAVKRSAKQRAAGATDLQARLVANEALPWKCALAGLKERT